MKCLQEHAPNMHQEMIESEAKKTASQGPSTATSSRGPDPPLPSSDQGQVSEPSAKRPRINLFSKGVPLSRDTPKK
jgi:hypothetical protein